MGIDLTKPIIDLRSPGEFHRGAVPGAVNIPLFDDGERHDVGSCYKAEGTAPAVSLGLEILARKATVFRDALWEQVKGGDATLYCWRGGMRSGSVALWLRSMGAKLALLPGGYKAYRHWVLAQLTKLAEHPLLVLNGRTGAGKTGLIQDLAREGWPVIDLEGLAHHRGSAFGGLAQTEAVPTQQNFENQLAHCYAKIAESPRIAVEIESVIGPIILTQALRKAIARAPMVHVSRDFDDRVQGLVATYAKGWDEASHAYFHQQLPLLRRFLSRDVETQLGAAIDRRDFVFVASTLLRLRYDPVYDKSLKVQADQVIASFNLTHEEGAAKRFIVEHLTQPLMAPSL